jgi:hypothetical protein
VSSTDRLIGTLLQAAQRSSGTVDFARLATVPPPVKRYLERVLREGQPLIRVARLEQVGQLRTEGSSPRRWLRSPTRACRSRYNSGLMTTAR